EQKRATGFFSVIRRDADRKLKAVPYSQEYREFLEPAAKLLGEAAALATNQTLKAFQTKRADAFMSDDYYASDVAWMELDAPIDVTFGPYETYEDELFSYRPPSKPTSRCAMRRSRRSSGNSAAGCRSWKTTCRLTRSTVTRNSARPPRSAWW